MSKILISIVFLCLLAGCSSVKSDPAREQKILSWPEVLVLLEQGKVAGIIEPHGDFLIAQLMSGEYISFEFVGSKKINEGIKRSPRKIYIAYE